MMDPTQAAPLTMSPTTEAGILPINTVATPGPVIVSPVAVMSVNLAAGKLIFSPENPTVMISYQLILTIPP
jgi:hypothetical protein